MGKKAVATQTKPKPKTRLAKYKVECTRRLRENNQRCRTKIEGEVLRAVRKARRHEDWKAGEEMFKEFLEERNIEGKTNETTWCADCFGQVENDCMICGQDACSHMAYVQYKGDREKDRELDDQFTPPDFQVEPCELEDFDGEDDGDENMVDTVQRFDLVGYGCCCASKKFRRELLKRIGHE